MPKNDPSVEDLLDDLSKKVHIGFGEKTEGLTTGNLAIDHLTGIGGLPIGRVTELYGNPGAGKTTTALQTAAELQRRIIAENLDEYILYLDYEHAMDEDYATGLGIDLDHRSFIAAQPHWMEQGVEIATKLINTGKVRLSIWDSVAEMTPRDTLEAEFNQRTGAMNRARLMKELLQRITPLAAEKRCAVVFLNHLMESVEMGGRPGMPPAETTPGGKSLKFYSSLRMSYKQIGQVKAKAVDALSATTTDQVVAVNTKVKITKNKVGKPFGETVIRVRLGRGFDNAWSALQVLLAYKQVRKDGAWYRFEPALEHPAMAVPASTTKGGRPSIQGEYAVLKFADEHPDWAEALVKAATTIVEAHSDARTALPETDDMDAFGDDLLG